MKTLYNLTPLWVLLLSFTMLRAQAPEYGYAVYYADYFQGKKTASGQTYDRYKLTCAHKVHPFGTMLKVTRTDNQKSVTVEVNDRGPYNPGCIVDLSWAAADQIGLLLDGKVEVRVEVVGRAASTGNEPPASPTAFQPPQAVPQAYDAPQQEIKQAPAIVQADQGIKVPIKIPAKEQPPTVAPPIPPAEDIPVAYSAFPEAVTAQPSEAPAMPGRQLGYSIQVGSYSHQPNAERQVEMLLKKGVSNVYLKKTPGPNGMLYRILVGIYPNKTEASKELPRLKSQYNLVGFVVNLANF